MKILFEVLGGSVFALVAIIVVVVLWNEKNK